MLGKHRTAGAADDGTVRELRAAFWTDHGKTSFLYLYLDILIVTSAFQFYNPFFAWYTLGRILFLEAKHMNITAIIYDAAVRKTAYILGTVIGNCKLFPPSARRVTGADTQMSSPSPPVPAARS